MYLPVPGFEPTCFCVPGQVCYPLDHSGREMGNVNLIVVCVSIQ